MAELAVRVESGMTSPVFVASSIDPAITGVYGYLMTDAPGVVAANVFVSAFNPVGSGKVMTLIGATISSYVTSGGASSRISLVGSRITAASGGSLQAASAITKFKSSYANSIAEVRIGNPTITLGNGIIAFPPPVGANTAYINDRITASPGAGITLAPGEGVAFRTSAGEITQTFNIAFSWVEG